MECTSIKFELFWRKISRKDGCKGVSETALRKHSSEIIRERFSLAKYNPVDPFRPFLSFP